MFISGHDDAKSCQMKCTPLEVAFKQNARIAVFTFPDTPQDRQITRAFEEISARRFDAAKMRFPHPNLQACHLTPDQLQELPANQIWQSSRQHPAFLAVAPQPNNTLVVAIWSQVAQRKGLWGSSVSLSAQEQGLCCATYQTDPRLGRFDPYVALLHTVQEQAQAKPRRSGLPKSFSQWVRGSTV